MNKYAIFQDRNLFLTVSDGETVYNFVNHISKIVFRGDKFGNKGNLTEYYKLYDVDISKHRLVKLSDIKTWIISDHTKLSESFIKEYTWDYYNNMINSQEILNKRRKAKLNLEGYL